MQDKRDKSGQGSTGGNATVRERAPSVAEVRVEHQIDPLLTLRARSHTVAFLPVRPKRFFSGTVGHGTKLRPYVSHQFSTAGHFRAMLSELFTIVTVFSTVRIGFQQNDFSQMRGTAGQKGLTLLNTTIKCPTKLSHFRDQWDSWDKELECKLQLVLTPAKKQAEACTLTFSRDRRVKTSDFAISVNNIFGDL
jgi:hypothetical protein